MTRQPRSARSVGAPARIDPGRFGEAVREGALFRDVYVTSRHHVMGVRGERVSYGTQHARRLGENRTICGERADGWTMFIDRRLAHLDASTCRGCERTLGLG